MATRKKANKVFYVVQTRKFLTWTVESLHSSREAANERAFSLSFEEVPGIVPRNVKVESVELIG